MKVFSIYIATNLKNDKKYIGFDSSWPKRKNDHRYESLTNNSNYALHHAIRKHGWDNFEWKVICEHWDGEYTLNVLEPYFIDVYDSFGKNGYNMTKGGEGRLGHICSTEHKEKIGKANKGKIPWNKNKIQIYSKETKQNMSEAKKGNTNAKGSKRSKESKERMSKAQKNIVKIGKNYLLIDPKGNEYKVNNLSKFCKENYQFNLYRPNLCAVASGKLRHYKNWKCFYI